MQVVLNSGVALFSIDAADRATTIPGTGAKGVNWRTAIVVEGVQPKELQRQHHAGVALQMQDQWPISGILFRVVPCRSEA